MTQLNCAVTDRDHVRDLTYSTADIQMINQSIQHAVTDSITGCDLSGIGLPINCPTKGSSERCSVASHTRLKSCSAGFGD